MRIVVILQKPCQNDKWLIISEMMKNEGREKCAESHVFCAISHTQHNGILLIFAITSKKRWKRKEKYL